MLRKQVSNPEKLFLGVKGGSGAHPPRSPPAFLDFCSPFWEPRSVMARKLCLLSLCVIVCVRDVVGCVRLRSFHSDSPNNAERAHAQRTRRDTNIYM